MGLFVARKFIDDADTISSNEFVGTTGQQNSTMAADSRRRHSFGEVGVPSGNSRQDGGLQAKSVEQRRGG